MARHIVWHNMGARGCPYYRDHNGRALEAGMPKLTLGPVSLPVGIWYSSEAGLPG